MRGIQKTLRRYAFSLLICSAVAFAQTNRGGISGTVQDSSGGAVAGATVVVTSIGTNQTWTVKTSKSGAYTVQNLEPVSYKIDVSAKGFTKRELTPIKVDTATTESINVKLQPGSVTSEVTVSSAPPIFNSESATLGQTITEHELDSLPMSNRSVLDLAGTAPNVSGDSGSEDPGVTSGAPLPGYNLNLNGGRSGSSMMMTDGVNNTGVGLARAVVSFSPETVQEFTVQTSSYSAEYGNTGGGIINVTTKSGTNQLHGEGMWMVLNPAFNAAPYTTQTVNRPTPTLKNNQLSFSVGGPVVLPKLYNGRNRTFFFFAVEPRYRTDHLQEDTLLPTDAMRQGDFSNTVQVAGGWAPADVAAKFGITAHDGTIYQQFNFANNQFTPIPAPGKNKTYQPFPNNVIPTAMLDPVSQKLLQYMPEPQAYYVDGSGNLVNYTLQRFLKQNYTRYTVRIDHTLSEANQLSFRYTTVPSVGITGFGSPVNGNGASYSDGRQIVLTETHVFSPTVANDFRLDYTRGVFSGTFSPQYDIKTGANLSTELGLPSLTHGGLPLFRWDTMNAFSDIGSEGSTLNNNVEERYSGGDIVYVTAGSMSLKMGFDIQHALLNEMSFYSAAGGNYYFRSLDTNSNNASNGAGGNAFASFLMGVPDSVTLADALIPYYYRWNAGDAFIQDDWKVKSNLTLNLGLRYSLQFPRTEKYNHQGTFLPELAKSYPVVNPPKTPIAGVPDITSVLVPPFAFDGMGGRSKYLWPVRWDDFEPRFGFAWTPNTRWNQRARFVVRGGYGISHAPLTGQNRLPSPNFGVPTTPFGKTSGQTDPNYAMRLSSNPPKVDALTPDQAIAAPADGLQYLPSLNYSSAGFILARNIKTPYVQNWNLAFDFALTPKTNIEVAYVGAKGTHLFMPRINANPTSIDQINAMYADNTSLTTTVPDPLGRTPIGNSSKPINVLASTFGSTYAGFSNLYTMYDTSANSIRHAAYISFMHRASRGLFVSANYTYGKSIDDASDGSPDKNALTTESVGGEVSFGAPAALDRSVSTFDVKHKLTSSFVYDLPFGHGQHFLSHMPGVVNTALGNWTVSGVETYETGIPFLDTLVDSNLLGDTSQTHTIRPNLVPGVPIVNPLYDPSCPTGNLCQPYLNPAAFERPALGAIGTAPRTLDGARGPMQQYLDLSLQKNFPIGERFRVQLRADFINSMNHPVFRPVPNQSGSDLYSAPSGKELTAPEYNAWAAYNNQPSSSTPAGAAMLATAEGFYTNNLLPTGVLPANFFSVPVPQGFAQMNPNSFDITTLQGYKLYRLKTAYAQGFGQLYAPPIQRTIQFTIKLYF